MYFSTSNMNAFKMVFLRYKRKYKFICFTTYGAIFQTKNNGVIALYKPL